MFSPLSRPLGRRTAGAALLGAAYRRTAALGPLSLRGEAAGALGKPRRHSRRPPVPNADRCSPSRSRSGNLRAQVEGRGSGGFERALARGKGVLFLTAHLGAWELSAFAHSLHGNWLHIVMRPMDNQYLDRLIEHYRTMHGNKTVAKDDFVRGLLAAMKAGETVGILMDTNMTPPQGVFVNFFGIPACTASGLDCRNVTYSSRRSILCKAIRRKMRRLTVFIL